jgi:hypothetical protein
MTRTLPLLLMVPFVFLTIIQYPYYLYERYDDTISIYRYDQWGNLYPVANFPDLQALVFRLGGFWWYW